MNPNYTDFRFPQIKAHPWHKVCLLLSFYNFLTEMIGVVALFVSPSGYFTHEILAYFCFSKFLNMYTSFECFFAKVSKGRNI